jgi:hypothetical protein
MNRLVAALLFCLIVAFAAPVAATVSSTTSAVTAQGNGVTTIWSYNFPIPSAADAVVTVTNTTVSPSVITTLSPTQYTITGVGTSSGGTVTYPTGGAPLASGYYLTIQRVVSLIQSTSLCNQGTTFCAIEHALDYLTYIAQQLQYQITTLASEFSSGQPAPIIGTVTPAYGGTGVVNPTANAVAIAEGANNFNFVSGNGESGLPLVSNGAIDPSYQALNVATGVTGTLSVANGGTGATSLSAHGILLGEGTGAITPLSPGTSGYVLVSNGASSDPSYQPISLSSPSSITGLSSGVGMSVATSSSAGLSQITLTITQIVEAAPVLSAPLSAGGAQIIRTNISAPLSLGITGAGGLDAGSVSGSANWLDVFAGYNGSTDYLFACTTATTGCGNNYYLYGGANAPSGTTYSGLAAVLAVSTGISNYKSIAGSVVGRKFSYEQNCIVATGIANQTKPLAESLSSCVPVNAKTASIVFYNSSTGSANAFAVFTDLNGVAACSTGAQVGTTATQPPSFGGTFGGGILCRDVPLGNGLLIYIQGGDTTNNRLEIIDYTI